MKRSRRNHAPAFKAKMALAALKGDLACSWGSKTLLSAPA
jgi:hypothetical protein